MTEDTKPLKVLSERDQSIIRDWNGGAAASDIGKSHGGISRSSVLGIIHRAKKAGHQVVSKGATGHQERTVRPEKPRRLVKAAQERRVPSRAPVQRKAIEAASAGEEFVPEVDKVAARYGDRQRSMLAPGMGEGVPFDSPGESCMWPLWGDDQRVGHVCGLGLRQVPDERTGELRPKRPYCDYHWAKAYPGSR